MVIIMATKVIGKVVSGVGHVLAALGVRRPMREIREAHDKGDRVAVMESGFDAGSAGTFANYYLLSIPRYLRAAGAAVIGALNSFGTDLPKARDFLNSHAWKVISVGTYAVVVGVLGVVAY